VREEETDDRQEKVKERKGEEKKRGEA